MKKVLVTGATGFIGRNTLPLLLEKGYEVHVPIIDDANEKPHQKANINYHQIDLLDQKQTSDLINQIKPTHVLHFAWIATPGEYQTSPQNEDWKNASLILFDECIKNGVQRIVGAGSCFEYDWSDGHCIENETPLNPTTFYGQQKVSCWKGLEDRCHAERSEQCHPEAARRMNTAPDANHTSCAWGRIFFLYGPHEKEGRLVSSVIQSLLNDEVAKCTHGKQIRDFMHVEDVASAFVALLESDIEGPVNIASGEPVTIAEIVNTIGKILGKEDKIALGAREAPPNEPPRITAETKRLNEEVGWKPRYTLEEGLKDTINWWQSVEYS